jgi:pyruvate dehydrogenase E1 component beta subunit
VAALTMVEALNQTLAEALARDPRAIILGEDVGRNGGVFRVTDGLYARFGADRVIDTPLAESAIVGTAIGLASYGLRPIVEIQFAGFLYPAFDQIAGQAARLRTRSAGRFSAPLVIRAPYGGGIRAPELHSDSIEALFVHTPGLKVVIPASPAEARGLLSAAIADPDPVIFLEPMPLYRAFREDVSDAPYLIPLGTLRVVRSGRDVTVVAWGAMVPVAMKAAEAIAERGIDAEVLDLRTLNPLDVDGLVASVQKTTRAVVIHEAPKTGGLGAEISAILSERCLFSLSAPILRVAAFDVPYPVVSLEKPYLPDQERLIKAITAVMET